MDSSRREKVRQALKAVGLRLRITDQRSLAEAIKAVIRRGPTPPRAGR